MKRSDLKDGDIVVNHNHYRYVVHGEMLYHTGGSEQEYGTHRGQFLHNGYELNKVALRHITKTGETLEMPEGEFGGNGLVFWCKHSLE